MVRFVFDAYAWVEYLEGSEKGKKVAQFLEARGSDIFTSAATLAEVVSKFQRTGKDSQIPISAIPTLSSLVSVTQEISIEAGRIHSEARKRNREFGMLDAFVAATARSLGAKILTGDDDFRPFPNAVFL
ncbi:MAG: PIN domain-containing protein [Candidatus Aenigmarchaeota archaeon]|nr:PIN domain-containing protein [Candidatus Aenigmarchaeota archaeon]